MAERRKKSEWSGSERRSSRRFPVSARVEIAWSEGGEHSGDFYITQDLSSRGLFLLCPKPLPMGSIIRVTLALPGVRQLLPLQGKVMRQVETPAVGVGVEFVNTPDEFQLLLDEYLSQLK